MDPISITSEALSLLKRFSAVNPVELTGSQSQLCLEGIDFFKKARYAVVGFEPAANQELGECIGTLLELFCKVIHILGVDFMEARTDTKLGLYALQTLCNFYTKYPPYILTFAENLFKKAEVYQVLEASLKHLPSTEATKMIDVQIVLMNLLVGQVPIRSYLDPLGNCDAILNLIRAYPWMIPETQDLCDGLIENLVDKGFSEAVFAEPFIKEGLMSDLQFEILGILCENKSVSQTATFYERCVNFFGHTIQQVDHLTSDLKNVVAVSTQLDLALKTLHDQLKVWMGWFDLTSSPEVGWLKRALTPPMAQQLLRHLLNLLQTLETKVPKVVTIKDSNHFKPSHLTLTSTKTWVMRVINNLIYEDVDLQDMVRELKFIPLVLNQCNVDDNQPYLRELGIFAVRNLTIQNPKNAEFIRSISPQGPAPSPALEELGLELAADSDGWPRVRRKFRLPHFG